MISHEYEYGYQHQLLIPSGKLPHNYGKSQFLMGKWTMSMAIFNSILLVYQRVNLHFPMVFLWFSYGFPMVYLGFLWFSMVFLWFSYGFPVVFLWFLSLPEGNISVPQKTTAWSESSDLATLWTSESQSLKHLAILTKNHHYINPWPLVTYVCIVLTICISIYHHKHMAIF